MVEDALVDVLDLNVREKCLEGFTFVLEPTDSVQSLIYPKKNRIQLMVFSDSWYRSQ